MTGEQELRWQVREGGRKEGVSHEEKDFHKKKVENVLNRTKKEKYLIRLEIVSTSSSREVSDIFFLSVLNMLYF